MDLHLQPCTDSDLELLVRISKTTFIDAFEKDNDSKDFKSYLAFAFDRNRLLKELEDQDTTFYFVYCGSELVGYLKLNENQTQTDIKSDESMELERIYVLQAFKGRRIGKWMLDEAKKIATGKRMAFLWLGVWEKNPRAIKFYQKHGFTKFGTHPYYIGKDRQTDWLMRVDLRNFDSE